jgi:hypothetical protein
MSIAAIKRCHANTFREALQDVPRNCFESKLDSSVKNRRHGLAFGAVVTVTDPAANATASTHILDHRVIALVSSVDDIALKINYIKRRATIGRHVSKLSFSLVRLRGRIGEYKYRGGKSEDRKTGKHYDSPLVRCDPSHLPHLSHSQA